MKSLLPILLSLLISTSAFCQSAVDSFFNIKTQKPPENWVELIQGKEWIPYELFTIRGKKAEMWNEDPTIIGNKMILDTTSIFIFNDRYNGLWFYSLRHPCHYLSDQNTFYWSDTSFSTQLHSGRMDEDTLGENLSQKVINVTDKYLSTSPIHFESYYDLKTGNIMTGKELKKKFHEDHISIREFISHPIMRWLGDPHLRKAKYFYIYKKSQP